MHSIGHSIGQTIKAYSITGRINYERITNDYHRCNMVRKYVYVDSASQLQVLAILVPNDSEFEAVNSAILKGRPSAWYECCRSRWAVKLSGSVQYCSPVQCTIWADILVAAAHRSSVVPHSAVSHAESSKNGIETGHILPSSYWDVRICFSPEITQLKRT